MSAAEPAPDDHSIAANLAAVRARIKAAAAAVGRDGAAITLVAVSKAQPAELGRLHRSPTVMPPVEGHDSHAARRDRSQPPLPGDRARARAAFLLGAVAGFASILVGRTNGIIDRVRTLNMIGDGDSPPRRRKR